MLEVSPSMTPLLTFENLQFRYEPFPIGLAAPVMDEERYGRMLDNFPKLELFSLIEDFGRKYALSEKHNPHYYRALLTDNPVWREFHSWVRVRTLSKPCSTHWKFATSSSA